MKHQPAILSMLALAIAGCGPTVNNPQSSQMNEPTINPDNWPKQASPLRHDPDISRQVDALLKQMTLEEKVGQVIQADIASVTPEEVKKYNLGSILNGGNSAPGNDNRTAPENWLALADAMWTASTDKSDGGVGIPLMWGVDAVHGHNNIVGATLFPHNIGLGAADDEDLMTRIGEITAREIRVTGNDWTFAPTVAVAQDDRWGRTFESYSENPDIVARYSRALVTGLQGKVNSDSFLDNDHVIATVKHFVGDGSTVGGKDQGDSRVSEAELRDIHAAGYPPAIQAGVQVAMASYNSWHGTKMHGFKAMLNDVLVGRMGFDGFVVGDWNGHGQVAGCEPTSCPQAFNAGLDMFMAPDSWKALYHNTLSQVQDGTISMARLDEAVSRILRVKARAGILDASLPSERPHAGNYDLLSAPEHRAVARQAVRQSLVLLKNNNQVLPVSPASTILVAGEAADNIGQAAGGWTLSWQGTGNTNRDFPNGQSILAGLQAQVKQAGGTVEYQPDGSYSTQPDVAIVVFGEQPYAEFQGDRSHLDYPDTTALELLKSLQNEGIPTVSVFLSGRPMWVNPEINASDAFVAAWLPGTEGGGIADVVLSNADDTTQHDFTGKLSFAWPATPHVDQSDSSDDTAAILFPLGYGLTYQSPKTINNLDETQAVNSNQDATQQFLMAGDPVTPWQLALTDDAGTQAAFPPQSASPADALTAVAADDQAQEDTVIFTWQSKATVGISGETVDISRQSNGDMAVSFEYKVLKPAAGTVQLGMQSKNEKPHFIDVTDAFRQTGDWQSHLIKLSCFSGPVDMSQLTHPVLIKSEDALAIQVKAIKVVSNQGEASCKL